MRRWAAWGVVTSALDQATAACRFADGRLMAIDLEYADGPFAIRGDYAGGVGRMCGEGPEGCTHDVVVMSLRTGKTVTRVATTPIDGCTVFAGRNCGDGAVGGLVIGRGGAVAWITCGHSCADRFSPAVWMAPPGGPRSQVAASQHIRPRSLRLSRDGAASATKTTPGATRSRSRWPLPALRARVVRATRRELAPAAQAHGDDEADGARA